jgi:sugar phosphate isomerase/epimerase
VTAPSRFSFNQATARHWPLPELVEGCRRAGVRGVGLWREPVAEYGLDRAAALCRDAGLAVTSLCRGGFFDAGGWWDDNRRAVDEAAALGTDVLILVSGGLPAGCRDLVAARGRVADAVARLAPYAAGAGVRLAVEPLHPMYCADRCVVSTIAQALRIAAPHPAGVAGVVVDTYHVWWDDRVYADIAAAAGRIAAFQLADWVTPLPAGVLTGRALPGAGCIDLRRLQEAVDATGFAGPIEVEVFNDSLWARPGAEVLAAAIDGYRRALTDKPS